MSVGLQRLREDGEAIRQGAIDKGVYPGLVYAALAGDARRRELLAEGDRLKGERNIASRAIADALRAGAAPDGPETLALRDQSPAAGKRNRAIEAELAEVEASVSD
ncbi:MAG: hypothetical protein ACHQXL_05035, partial [Candidatus Limnocylindrales bacterium]